MIVSSSSSGTEVDIVIETPDQRVVALEIKIAASVGSSDFKHLAWFRDQLGDRFIKGAVLYTGARVLPFGDRLGAVPLFGIMQRTGSCYTCGSCGANTGCG